MEEFESKGYSLVLDMDDMVYSYGSKGGVSVTGALRVVDLDDDFVLPDDFDAEYEHYHWTGTELEKIEDIVSETDLNRIRAQRATECFPIINRGTLWYEHLTEEQHSELDEWYQAWLDATDTMEIPEMPVWIDAGDIWA